ncbi:MAG: alcohol dehydrogenase catalytic domain-containing protein [Fulvimarina manganoxydans]|uniref:alcohol dehydrogenase catalytic domain-containing protein n=1 Tax=Fulvimarina manganoxydans TaxID=937218 RepID=UPI002353FC10|nr:alcohol dehydrogenase catalytic domain-containing protein [Fulvimarina manganoxydans]MCK5933962.1 alcohol dehydrogenase catalytic domain-containing protein [Fulvimarina manganoxydans]
MKALVYTGPKALDYRDAPDPQPRDGEAIVKVEAVGICGSDMHAFLGHDERRPAPLILGHEAAGTVETGNLAGKRVTVNPLVTCGTCEACRKGRNNLCPNRQIISMAPRPGAFAEYLAIPETNLVEIPDGVSVGKACLAEPIACGWHAVRVALRHDPDALKRGTCLVIGGGAIGLGAALSLQAAGATRIIIAETNLRRHGALQSAGPFEVVDPTSEPISIEADVVIDGVGFSATRKLASRIAKPGGIIVHIGLGESEGGLDIRRMTLQEIAFVGTYTYTPEDFRQTAAAIFDGRLGTLDWPQTRALSEGAAAFGEILNGSIAAPKIVLAP